MVSGLAAERRPLEPCELEAPTTARQRRFVRPVQEYIETETAALAALIWANSSWRERYEQLLDAVIAVDLAFWEVAGSFHF